MSSLDFFLLLFVDSISLAQCDLYKSGLKEKIAVHVKEDGSIMGLDYSAPQGPLSITRDCSRPKLNAEGSDGKVKISSSVKVAKESEGQT
jgi:hypothetical protein